MLAAFGAALMPLVAWRGEALAVLRLLRGDDDARSSFPHPTSIFLPLFCALPSPSILPSLLATIHLCALVLLRRFEAAAEVTRGTNHVGETDGERGTDKEIK
ncbi:hypothetical protein E2C01_095730 [Portunus trituberculatus]|uniref:Uncharacterized protein n=1 Tax=Portunus trituberculatus TaxID=210409 RepID=A0A5B7JTS6_PORTR|nr:hypothetical protein [Portunus trituberculatus]